MLSYDASKANNALNDQNLTLLPRIRAFTYTARANQRVLATEQLDRGPINALNNPLHSHKSPDHQPPPQCH